MRLSIQDLYDKHKNTPAVISVHGPNLNYHRDRIERLQKENKIIRFSVNNWFDYFDKEPDYWVTANGEFSIQSAIFNSGIWSQRNYPPNAIYDTTSTVLFADSVDMSNYETMEKNLKCNYLGYDQRHFKSHTCMEILKNFKIHYEKEKNFDFKYYGNNSNIWKPVSKQEIERIGCNPVYGQFGAAFSGIFNNGRCCARIEQDRPTIQETLQQSCNHDKHYSTGDSVALHAIAFAIIMGCNPIYVAGMNLDYRLGFAKAERPTNRFVNAGTFGHWELLQNGIKSDLTIINESAKNNNIRIINLLKDSWYGILEEGEKII